MKRLAFMPRVETKVKVIGLDGHTMPSVFKVSNIGGGYADLTSGTKILERVHIKRLLPADSEYAIVVDNGDGADGRKKGICPKCGQLFPFDVEFECPTDGQFEVKEIGELAVVTTKKEPVKAKEKAAKVAKEAKVEKLDLSDLKKQGELWSKQAKFDHVQVEAKAYTFIVQAGTAFRKFCFNTYNGALGKKAQPINVKFIQQGKDGNGKVVGYAVDDVAKERERLKKNGFHRLH